MRLVKVVPLLCLGALSPALAQTAGQAGGAGKNDFARHWPVRTGEVGIYAVTLTPALYAQIQRPDLGDLAAFNAAGEAMAFEPMAAVWRSPESRWRPAHFFALPAGSDGDGDGLSLQVEKAADGRVSLRAVAEPPGTTSRAGPGGDLLVDTGVEPEERQCLQALAFDFDPAAVELSAQVRVDASGDLESWRTLVASAGLLRLQQAGRLLQRQQIELGGARERYLRVIRLDSQSPLPVAGVRVETRDAQAPDPRPRRELVVPSVAREAGAFLYRLPARIPIEQIDLRLADNTVAVARVSSREDAGDVWRYRGTLTAFRLRAAGVELDNEPLSSGGSRDREWRLDLENDPGEAPALVFRYRPERWLLLSKGPAPYVLAAGSRRATRARLPLKALLAPMRAKYGDDWQPPEVELDPPVLAAGDAALEATLEERWSRSLLWGLLIASALAITIMVLRLLREPPGETGA